MELPQLVYRHSIEIELLVHPAFDHHDSQQTISAVAALSSKIVDLATNLREIRDFEERKPKWFKYLSNHDQPGIFPEARAKLHRPTSVHTAQTAGLSAPIG
jgi:hypothetical protein